MILVIELRDEDADGIGGQILTDLKFTRIPGKGEFRKSVVADSYDEQTMPDGPEGYVFPIVERLADHGVKPRRVRWEERAIGTVTIGSALEAAADALETAKTALTAEGGEAESEAESAEDPRVEKLSRVFQALAEEKVAVEKIHDVFYAIGSERAALRLFYEYNQKTRNTKTNAGEAKGKGSGKWFFSIEPGAGGLSASAAEDEVAIQASSQEVAKTIIDQMGGAGRIRAMTGAKRFVFHNEQEGGVSFQFPNSGGPNAVKVILTAMDTYTVTFFKGSRVVKEMDDVYAEDLKPLFEKETGLYLSL